MKTPVIFIKKMRTTANGQKASVKKRMSCALREAKCFRMRTCTSQYTIRTPVLPITSSRKNL